MRHFLVVIFAGIVLNQWPHRISRVLGKEGQKAEFSFQNCGEPHAMITVHSFSVSPDPLTLPGSIFVTGNITVNENISSPVVMNVNMLKWDIGTYTKLSCSVDNIGSCHYEDLCAVFKRIQCQGCQCGLLKTNSSMIRNAEFGVTKTLLSPGKYRIISNMTQENKQVACLNMTINIS